MTNNLSWLNAEANFSVAKHAEARATSAEASPTDRPLMTCKDVARVIASTEDAVRQMVYRRTIPHVRLGRLVRFVPDELDAWIRRGRVKTDA